MNILIKKSNDESLGNINNIFKDISDNIVFVKNNLDSIKSKLKEKSFPRGKFPKKLKNKIKWK